MPLYSYNSSNQLTSNSNATFGYDYNGNTLTKTDSTGTTNYAWDYETRLSSVTLPNNGGTISFKYDPFGRRVQKSFTTGATPPVTTTTNYAYDGDNLIEEVDASGIALARYTQTQNVDEPLAMLRSATTSYYQAGGLGSVTSLSNTAGALAQSYTFNSFGKQTASSGSLTNPFQYTAREFDTETSLYYYRARYYDAVLGRFISEDPIRFDGSIDFFAYVDNNVTKSKDPFGLGPYGPSLPQYANPVATCEQQFQECKKKAKHNALKGGFIVFVASGIVFDTAVAGCVGLSGPAAAACILAVEHVQTAVTPILLAPFGGDYFGNVADCWDKKTKCIAQPCKK